MITNLVIAAQIVVSTMTQGVSTPTSETNRIQVNRNVEIRSLKFNLEGTNYEVPFVTNVLGSTITYLNFDGSNWVSGTVTNDRALPPAPPGFVMAPKQPLLRVAIPGGASLPVNPDVKSGLPDTHQQLLNEKRSSKRRS